MRILHSNPQHWFQHSLVWLYLVPKGWYSTQQHHLLLLHLSVCDAGARERYLAVCYPNHHTGW